MALDLNFTKEFLILLKKSSVDGFSYSIPFDSKDKDLMLHISALDIAILLNMKNSILMPALTVESA